MLKENTITKEEPKDKKKLKKNKTFDVNKLVEHNLHQHYCYLNAGPGGWQLNAQPEKDILYALQVSL